MVEKCTVVALSLTKRNKIRVDISIYPSLQSYKSLKLINPLNKW